MPFDHHDMLRYNCDLLVSQLRDSFGKGMPATNRIRLHLLVR
jgi:hypothetical protein